MSLHAEVSVRLGGFDLDATVDVGDGEIVALLGPNGAGKSTFLRIVAGLVPLNRGRVVLGDRVLEDSATRVRVRPESRRIGVVFQDYLLSRISARERMSRSVCAHAEAWRLPRDRAPMSG